MNKCIDLEAKRLQNATVLILGREKDDLLGILSIESTDNDHVFSMNKAKMKRISEVEANRIVDDLTNQDRSLPIVGINGHTKEKKFFYLADLSIEKVILSS
ncbi:hypothetical protein SAMN04487821_12775 [Enterococcus malodoratus]|uniref:hypothetical protein n=1 Tax=Enterococcus malodoratus TaxID=71451 RepID=UPI0008C1F2D4|nr:hypothetical protein [Enterococcus malodoratus]SET89398.1 hypothetical protein SAMN04487821_12775 [Enterococcus malodoratus]